MLSQNIKFLRMKQGLTQKELADKLHVTSQAVSRWENGDVEPSISTLSEMCKIFEVSIDELVGLAEYDGEVLQKSETEEKSKETKQIIAVCGICNKAIYEKDDLHSVNISHPGSNARRKSWTETKTVCSDCAKALAEAKKREEESKIIAEKSKARSARRKAFGWGTAVAAILLIIGMIVCAHYKLGTGLYIAVVGFAAVNFTFVSSMFFGNNFLADMFETIALWGYVRFPGLIFELSLDGIIWLLTVKLAFWIIGIILATAFMILAYIVCAVLSVFVFPFAVRKNFVEIYK